MFIVYATVFLFIDHITWEEINLIKASRFMSSASVYTEKNQAKLIIWSWSLEFMYTLMYT